MPKDASFEAPPRCRRPDPPRLSRDPLGRARSRRPLLNAGAQGRPRPARAGPARSDGTPRARAGPTGLGPPRRGRPGLQQTSPETDLARGPRLRSTSLWADLEQARRLDATLACGDCCTTKVDLARGQSRSSPRRLDANLARGNPTSPGASLIRADPPLTLHEQNAIDLLQRVRLHPGDAFVLVLVGSRRTRARLRRRPIPRWGGHPDRGSPSQRGSQRSINLLAG